MIRIQQWVRDNARSAGRVAHAVLKSTAHFLGACGIVAIFGFAAYQSLLDARKPDAELLHRAIEKVHNAARAVAAAHPSALAERDAALIAFAVAAVLGAVGVFWLVEWWKSLPLIRKAAKP